MSIAKGSWRPHLEGIINCVPNLFVSKFAEVFFLTRIQNSIFFLLLVALAPTFRLPVERILNFEPKWQAWRRQNQSLVQVIQCLLSYHSQVGTLETKGLVETRMSRGESRHSFRICTSVSVCFSAHVQSWTKIQPRDIENIFNLFLFLSVTNKTQWHLLVLGLSTNSLTLWTPVQQAVAERPLHPRVQFRASLSRK